MRALFGLILTCLFGLWRRYRASIARAWADYEAAMATT